MAKLAKTAKLAKKAKPQRKAPQKANPHAITDQQDIFCREYIVRLSAAAAARAAGYSPASAGSIGYQLLQNPRIAERIAGLQAERIARLKYDADNLLHRLIDEAEADISDIIDERGQMLPVRDWPAVWRRGLVSGIKVKEIYAEEDDNDADGFTGDARPEIGRIVEIKLADRMKRLEALGRHVSVNAFRTVVRTDPEDPLVRMLKQAMGKTITPNPASATYDDDETPESDD